MTIAKLYIWIVLVNIRNIHLNFFHGGPTRFKIVNILVPSKDNIYDLNNNTIVFQSIDDAALCSLTLRYTNLRH